MRGCFRPALFIVFALALILTVVPTANAGLFRHCGRGGCRPVAAIIAAPAAVYHVVTHPFAPALYVSPACSGVSCQVTTTTATYAAPAPVIYSTVAPASPCAGGACKLPFAPGP